MTRRLPLLLVLLAATVASACGKKGPPLPPLVLLPRQPAEVKAIRRGDQVELSFRVPKDNVDGSTPASLKSVDVYAWTVPGPVDAAEVLRRGVRVGGVPVNKPPDPDKDESSGKPPAPKGPGVEQNAVATFTETLTAADPKAYRVYVLVGLNQRGRRGGVAPRVAVPLVAPPPAPLDPTVTYDEKAVTLTWTPPRRSDGVPPYRYLVRRPEAGPAPITPTPLDAARFVDGAPEWGKERCYDVRTVSVVESVLIQSDAPPLRCVTPKDTFPPAAPDGLVGVGGEGAISLIWTANREADLAGYLVLRSVAPASQLTPVTPAPIADTNFRDAVPAGARATYVVVAVDRAGNRSEASTPVTETAR